MDYHKENNEEIFNELLRAFMYEMYLKYIGPIFNKYNIDIGTYSKWYKKDNVKV